MVNIAEPFKGLHYAEQRDYRRLPSAIQQNTGSSNDTHRKGASEQAKLPVVQEGEATPCISCLYRAELKVGKHQNRPCDCRP